MTGAYLPVRGVLDSGDPNALTAVAELTPASGSMGATPIRLKAPVVADGKFQVPLVDVMSGRYKLAVWVEDKATGERKAEKVQDLVFQLGPPRLTVQNLDKLRDAVIDAPAPYKLKLTVESDLGARVSVQVNDKRLKPVQLKLPRHTFTVELEEGVNILSVGARNILNDGPSTAFQITVEQSEEEDEPAAAAAAPKPSGGKAAAPAAPRPPPDPRVLAMRDAQKELDSLAKAKDYEGLRTKLADTIDEYGTDFRDKRQYGRRLDRVEDLYEKLVRQSGSEVEDDVCEANRTAQQIHADKLFRAGYLDSKNLAAEASSRCKEMRAAQVAVAGIEEEEMVEIPVVQEPPPAPAPAPAAAGGGGDDDFGDDEDMPSLDALDGLDTGDEAAASPEASAPALEDMPEETAPAVAANAGATVDVGALVNQAAAACGSGDNKKAAAILEDVNKMDPSKITPSLALCGARGAFDKNNCKLASPLARKASSLGAADPGVRVELKLIEGTCAGKSGKKSAAYAALADAIRAVAGGASIPPAKAANLGRSVVGFSADIDKARAALSPCTGKAGVCIAITKSAERAIGTKFPARLSVSFEKKGCSVNIIDPKSMKQVTKLTTKKKNDTFEVPAGTWRAVIECPPPPRSLPDAHSITLEAGGTAAIQHTLKINPNVLVKIVPGNAAFTLDDAAQKGKNGSYEFNKDKEVVTKGYQLRADGYHTERGSMRINKIDDTFKLAMAKSAALDRFDKGIVARRSGNQRKAIDEFNKALLVDSNFAQATLMLGLTQYELQEYGPAKATLQRLVNVDTDTRYTTIARFYLAAQDLVAAINSGANLARFEKVAKRMKGAHYRIRQLYSVLPSMDQSPVPYRDDAQYWLAKAYYHRFKAAQEANMEASQLKKHCKDARKAWKKVKSQVTAFVGPKRIEYDTEYKAERKEKIKELKAACK